MNAPIPAAILTDSNRPIRLRIWNQSGVSEDVLLVKHVSGTETMCGGIDYHLLCVASRVGMPLKEFIANPVELQFVTDTGDLRSVCGIVAEAADARATPEPYLPWWGVRHDSKDIRQGFSR